MRPSLGRRFGSRTDASRTYAGLGPFGIDEGLYKAAARYAEQELALKAALTVPLITGLGRDRTQTSSRRLV
jgi:hypothetical protein